MSIVIGKHDGITYQFMPKVGETDVFIESAEGQGRQIIRFLDVESLKIFQEALERMQLGMAVARKGLGPVVRTRLDCTCDARGQTGPGLERE